MSGFARGMARGFFGFMALSIRAKPSKQPWMQTFKKAMRSPFPRRKGGRDGGRAVGGNPRNPLIRLIRDSDTVGWRGEDRGFLYFAATLIALKQNVNRTSFMSLDDGLRLASYSLSTLNSHCQLSVVGCRLSVVSCQSAPITARAFELAIASCTPFVPFVAKRPSFKSTSTPMS